MSGTSPAHNPTHARAREAAGMLLEQAIQDLAVTVLNETGHHLRAVDLDARSWDILADWVGGRAQYTMAGHLSAGPLHPEDLIMVAAGGRIRVRRA